MNEDKEDIEAEEIPTPDGEKSLDGLPEKTMAERAKEIGRDGAYLELQATDLIKAFRSGDLQKAKMVIIKAARIELSDPNQVVGLAVATGLMANSVTDVANEESNMTDEQASLAVFLNLLSAGLTVMTSPR